MQDTDADWALLGEGEPYFAVLSDERFLRRNLTPETLEEFWKSGVNDMAGFAEVVDKFFGRFPRGTALDFGCGVGRLTHGMAAMCEHVIGLDISPGMLAEARRHPRDNMEFLDRLDDQTFDWVSSIIVFQHIPPRRGYALFDDLLRRVNHGGAITLHVTLYRDSRVIRHLTDELQGMRWDGDDIVLTEPVRAAPGSIMMYDYDLGRLLELTVKHGFQSLMTQHTDHGGHHGVILYGRKGM